MGDGVREILSVGIGLWEERGPGGKKAIECNRDEIVEECKAQLFGLESFWEKVGIDESDIVRCDIWPSFQFGDGKLCTWEPKFSNNVGTWKNRPESIDTEIANLYHSTGYVKTDTSIFNMNSTCAAGGATAQAIIAKLNSNLKTGKPIEIEVPTVVESPGLFWGAIQRVDRCCMLAGGNWYLTQITLIVAAVLCLWVVMQLIF